MFWARAAYRSRQFFAALRPTIGGDDRLLVARRLPSALQPLFYSMSPRDQRHALDVARALLAEGDADDALVQAALLHDVGKGRLRLWHRVAFVLLQTLSPRLVARLVPAGSSGWRAPFDRLLRHAQLGAQLLEEAVAPAETVRLVRYHEGADFPDARLARLRAADDRC